MNNSVWSHFSIFTIFLMYSSEALSMCPSPDIDDVINDDVVKAAMDTSWIASVEGTPNEHEEGFYIYQCRSTAADGTAAYTTELDFGTGTFSALILPPRRSDSRCRLVGDFHTHPGVSRSDPRSNDPFENDRPSPQDLTAGIPGIIRYGIGSNPANTTDITYNVNVNPNLSWNCPDLFRVNSRLNTSISVAKGNSLSFEASGIINLGFFAGNSTPEGIDYGTVYNYYNDARHGQLLGVIDGNAFIIGRQRDIVSPWSGMLELLVNDNDPQNNSGSYAVRVGQN